MDSEEGRGDTPMFARTGIGSPFGKLDCDVKTHLDEHTYNLFLQKAARIGVLPGELNRDLICKFVHGLTYAEICAKHAREAIEAEGPNAALIGGAA